MMPVGPFFANLMLVSTGPISSTSSSWQSLTKWSSGVTRRTFSLLDALTLTMTPTAFSLTRWQKSCTTSNPTSASSSAVRTSFSASSTVGVVELGQPLEPLLGGAEALGQRLEHWRRETYHMRP